MKTSVFRAFLATAFAVGSMALLPQQAAAQINKGLPLVELTIGKAKLKAEVAADNNTRTVGLMNRFSLQPDHGMLFDFQQEQMVAFWMKNTKIPLDILYFDEGWILVGWSLDTPPCSLGDRCPSYPSHAPARYVLELNAGTSARIGVQLGDRLTVSGLESR